MATIGNNYTEGGNTETAPKETPKESPNVAVVDTKALRPNDSLFSSLALVLQGAGKDEGTRQGIVDKAFQSRVIDLPQATSFLKTAKMNIASNGALFLSLNNGQELFNHTVTPSERKMLSDILNNGNLDNDQKTYKIQDMVSSISMATQLSYNFEQQMQKSQSMEASIHR